MEWQAWHFLKTRRPAEASPVVGVESEVGAASGAGGADDCAAVVIADGGVFAAMWS